jgi:predicted HAD superfamily phosphohydrolase YqeG
MLNFFEKKLILLDVDNTLLDWRDWKTIWSFRSDWTNRKQLSRTLSHSRGIRTTPELQNYPLTFDLKPPIAAWFVEALPWMAANNIYIAIFSDHPQPQLWDYFTAHQIHTIVDASEIGCSKPLPDGIEQIQAFVGISAHNTFIIGDGLYTDGRSAQRNGAHFIPVQTLQEAPIETLTMWLYDEEPS